MLDDTTYLDFPFALSTQGRTKVTDEDDHVKDMIRLVLFTAPGERVNRPEFGCGLKQLLFAPNSDALAAATEQLVHGSLIRWLDPVIAVEQVSVTSADSTLEIAVVYRRRTASEKRDVAQFTLSPS